MRLPRLLSTVAVLLVSGATATSALAAKTPTRTFKVTGGTTVLTIDPVAASNLQAAGVAMTGTAPATTTGTKLKFPIGSGTIKVKGTKILSAKVVHRGGLMMASATTQIALTDLAVNLGGLTGPSLAGKLGALEVDIATLKIPKTGIKITGKKVTLTKVVANLTPTAAGALNGQFAVSTFKAGDPIGVATLTANVKKR